MAVDQVTHLKVLRRHRRQLEKYDQLIEVGIVQAAEAGCRLYDIAKAADMNTTAVRAVVNNWNRKEGG